VSMKNRHLLSHNGRNQFGDPGEGAMPRYVPSPEEEAQNEAQREEHRQRNNEFLNKHQGWWLAKFVNAKTMKAVWSIAFPHGRPSYSTFCKECKEFSSLEEYLCYLLLSQKRLFLSASGFSREEVAIEMKTFKKCGRYPVSYGSSQRTFGSI